METSLKICCVPFSRVSRRKAGDGRDSKDEYTIRNGALLLQKQISSGHVKGSDTDPVQTFTAREIELATNNYDLELILGWGITAGYRGTLEDGRVVAIKSTRGLLPTQGITDFFLNQAVIKQMINHKNVAKLHGVCLETKVPALVHEFYPNGSLSDQIHGQDDGNRIIPAFNIPWSKLVRIASETSHALSYMHLALPKPIIHMDVKPTSIYLDESFSAKLSNFGHSVSISPDEDFISQVRVGTLAYTDPEFLVSRRVTEKCDVYSLGITLMELLTGECPKIVMETGTDFKDYFEQHLQQGQVSEIVHPRVIREAATEEIRAFAEVALRCAAMRGEERPTMREVALELRQIHLTAKLREGSIC